MSVVIALLAAVRNLPWQAWAVAGALLAAGLYGCHEYERGRSEAVAKIEQKQREASDAAQKEVDRLRNGDRSRVMQFDRD